MSRSRLISHWDQDLRGLSDDQVRARLRYAQVQESESLQRPGRNPKAARTWREKAGEAQTELERRGLTA